MLEIGFQRVKENPMIHGIEVLVTKPWQDNGGDAMTVFIPIIASKLYSSIVKATKP